MGERWWEQYKVDVPEGQSGKWKIEKFEIDAKSASFYNISAGRRTVTPGVYTRLMRGSEVIMSDTKAEILDHLYIMQIATGRVLVNGLGLGMVLNGILGRPQVEHLTVVEISSDVIALSAGYWQDKFGDRLTIIQADALQYSPPRGSRYSFVWHDIWDNICSDNLDSMKTLHRKYGRRSTWQGSWGKDEVQYYARRST